MRPLQTVHSDGSLVKNEYAPLTVSFFDENETGGSAAPRTTRRDGLGRIVEIVERDGAESLSTQYRWSPLGDLIEVRDAQENLKTLTYDSLRRKVSMQDPDRGTTTYEYDDVGNMLTTQDAKGQIVEREYDFANRLIAESRPDGGPGGAASSSNYTYDLPSTSLDFGDGTSGTATFTPSRLASVTDPSGETHFSYDGRGNTVWTVKRIREPNSGLLVGFRTQMAYDLLDRLTEVIYPDNDRVHYAYNAGSFVERVDAGPEGAVLVDNFDYHPSSEVARTEFGNGVVTQCTYDVRQRLRTIVTQGPANERLIDCEQVYDPASDVVQLVDRRPFTAVERGSPRRNTQIFAYDGLHRLTRTRYAHSDDLNSNLGQIDYAYDAIGNIVARTTPAPGQPGHLEGATVNLGSMIYSGGRTGRAGRAPGDPPGPHAVTATSSGRALSYDANGNVSKLDGADLAWDSKDQLVGYEKAGVSSTHLYDYNDRRIVKTVTTGDHSEETLYVDQYYEERPGGTPVKHVFVGDTRIARVEGFLDSTRDRIQRIRLAQGWNSVVVAVDTTKTLAQVFGADAAFYVRQNASYVPREASSVAAKGVALWVHVPTARLAIVQGKYAPASTSTAVSPGGTFLAWPKLESFHPSAHLSAEGRIHVHDPQAGRFPASRPGAAGFSPGSWRHAAVGRGYLDRGTGGHDAPAGSPRRPRDHFLPHGSPGLGFSHHRSARRSRRGACILPVRRAAESARRRGSDSLGLRLHRQGDGRRERSRVPRRPLLQPDPRPLPER
jgi:YD repeat-containing protein